MLGRLMPREERFFDYYNAHAERIVEGSRALAAMLTTFSDLEVYAQRIDAAERSAASMRCARRSRTCTRRSSNRSTATRCTR